MGTPTVGLAGLRIRDFRGIESLYLDFRGPDGLPNQLVVLAGPNGCGKTTVLEAALRVLGGEDLLKGPYERDAIRRGADDYQIYGDLIGTLSPEGKPTKWTATASSLYFPLEPKTSPWDLQYYSSWRAPSLVGAMNPTIGRPGRRPAETDRNRLLNVKQRLVNAAAVERFGGPPIYSQVKQSIDRAWQAFYPGGEPNISVEVVTSDEAEGGSFDVFINTSKHTPLPVDLMSSGQLELFLFLGSLALSKEDGPTFVFIDEPELHLDPQWHRLIVRTLLQLRPHTQFILATHSPEIYDEAKSYERHFLIPADDPRARAWTDPASSSVGD